MAANRRNLFDIPKKLNLNEELSDWADLCCEKRNWSFSRYIRLLIEEHKKRCEKELSSQNQTDTRPKQGQTTAHPGGLYTAEQVAQLINAMKVEK
jgi:hypothetical protein